VVVVVPCLVLAVAWWAGHTRAARVFVVVAGVFGALAWAWLVAEVLDRRRTLIFDFESTANPLYRAWRLMLPDYRHPEAGDWVLQVAWFAALAAVAVLALHASRSRSSAAGRSGPGLASRLGLRRSPRPAPTRRP
jgi:hypothetical protein